MTLLLSWPRGIKRSGGFFLNLHTEYDFFLVSCEMQRLEMEMATQSSTLAWKIPWTEEPGRLQSMESQGVGHDWAPSHHIKIFKHFWGKILIINFHHKNSLSLLKKISIICFSVSVCYQFVRGYGKNGWVESGPVDLALGTREIVLLIEKIILLSGQEFHIHFTQ